MSWLHDSGLAAWATFAVVLFYTWETARTRKQLVIQNRRAVLPFITVEFKNDNFLIKNIGNSSAVNLSIDTLRSINDNPRLSIGFAIAYTLAPNESVNMPYGTMVDGEPTKQQLTWAKEFFPTVTETEHTLTIRFQTVEGKPYKQTVVLRPFKKVERPVEVSAVQSDGLWERFKEALTSPGTNP